MFGPKIYAICGAVGFGLSFLVGLFCGADFFLVLIRAAVFGVLFAGLAVGCSFVFRKFLPEIFEDAPASSDSANSHLGKGLDVTVGGQDEDFPFSSAPPGEAAAPPDGAAAGTGSAEPQSAGKSGGMSASVADAGPETLVGGAVPEFSEDDFVESAADTDDAEKSGGAENVGVSAEDFSDGMQETPAAQPEEKVPPPPAAEETVSEDGLDVLPDVSAFVSVEPQDGADSFQPADSAFSGASDAESSGGAGSGGTERISTRDFSASDDKPEFEAETMAKAIRTVLSKE